MPNNILSKVRIVLVETTHPGNIGAGARAMKTMGYQHLYLVSPKIYPHAEATARAAGADDILANAVVCSSLAEAVSECGTVIATTARRRSISLPEFSPREYAPTFINSLSCNKVALVFGRENSGLSNQELELCNIAIQIPANPDYSSLNIACAVQLICYEFSLMVAQSHRKLYPSEEQRKIPFATNAEMKLFYEHLEQCMTEIEFFNPDKPRRLMRRLKFLFNRSQLDRNEANILRGFLAAIQKAVK